MEGCTKYTCVEDYKEITEFIKDGKIVAKRITHKQPFGIVETWYQGDKKHREDGPAEICYYENGNKQYEKWYRNDKKHRDDGPAIIRYHKDGDKSEEHYYCNGKRHRDNDLPAEIGYFKNGNKRYESWWCDGKKHRDDGPAKIYYYDNGNKNYEFWYRRGKICRSGVLSALIYYDFESRHVYWFGNRLTYNVTEFRDYTKGDAIYDTLRILPLPISQAIATEYCYQ